MFGQDRDAEGKARFVDDPAVFDTGPPPAVDIGTYEFPDGAASSCAADLEMDVVVDAFDLLNYLTDWLTSKDTPECS